MLKIEPAANVIRLRQEPKIISRSEHNISRAAISENALKALYRLKNAGYKAYLVGGGVRDLLLDLKPKDFDVVTDARPEQVRELFRNCRLIGRRFRLAHVRFGNEIIEVSTFRAEHHAGGERGHAENGRIIRDNVYGDIDEDVWRRDFTVNALFYNIADFSLVDYVGGLDDIRARQLRLIGNPEERYREDPVRMLRAIRFAAKLGFSLHPATEQPIRELEHLLRDVPAARLFEEFMKFFMTGHALESYLLLRRHELFVHMCAETSQVLDEETSGSTHNLLVQLFKNTDIRFSENRSINPGFLFTGLLWAPVMNLVEEYKSNGLAEMDAMALASDAVISRQVKNMSLPRRFTHTAREIWNLQSRLKHHHGKRPFRLLSHPRFRAAYDFMLLRAESGENIRDLADWWTDFLASNSSLTAEPAPPVARPSARRRRHRHRAGRR